MRFGFNITVEDTVYDLEKVVFCQMQPVYTATGWTMVRQLDRALSKDLMTVIDISREGAYRKFLHAIGSGGIAIAGGVPVVSALYTRMKKDGKSGGMGNHPWLSDSGFMHLAKASDREGVPITDDARVSFWRAFGIVPDTQIEMERLILEKPFSFNHPVTFEVSEDNLQLETLFAFNSPICYLTKTT